ncbi:MAG: ribulose-phosphate 3-epimerase, partial [Clostridia bacterium]|nr:ribulose-phosphate 3-epimerase [Clostridia bacterium]
MNTMICPSVMCADMLHLENDIRILENCRADYLHMDIMDGEFVPNYTLGTDLIKTLHAFCSIPQDIHLMISHPEKKLERFDITAGDCVSFHYEASCDIPFCIYYIKSKGAKPILAIN